MESTELELMDINSSPGTKVVFSGQNGLDEELDFAKNILTVGKEYTVAFTEVYASSTDVFLEEVDEGSFNSVHFVTPLSWEKSLKK